MHIKRIDIRHIGALAALVMAGIYFLIGLGVLNVGTSTSASGAAPDLFVFGVGAGTAFAIVAALLAFTDRRWIWAAALVFQVLVFITYIGVSGGRVPSYEVWGLTLRTIQLVVMASLAYLTFTPSDPRTMEVHR